MTILQLFIDLAQDYTPDISHTFIHFGHESVEDHGAPLQFKNARLIAKGNSSVYKGRLCRVGFKSRRMVCKIVSRSAKAVERLKNEAQLYTKELKILQGVHVPSFFGLYMGQVDGCIAACILFEDGGVPLDDDVSAYPEEFRISVMQSLMCIHKCGVQHGDFDTSNIVVDDAKNPKRHMIIDFDNATYHQCQRSGEVFLYEIGPPAFADFKCSELWWVGQELDIWTPSDIMFQGIGVPLRLVNGPEDVLDYVKKRHWNSPAPQNHMTLARNAIIDYANRYGDRVDYMMGRKVRALEPMVDAQVIDFMKPKGDA
ncbi:hypothetical protein NM688_g7072 [Phlebia brevispora]|uniref:Uncharacterized protein n=1 Tax=Phlebia brevispora TaxID=194682 RepID=A0ACC1S9E4_9APHY|nr:hypothetical protein NM688_g7072 [Phlebia brevispora]